MIYAINVDTKYFHSEMPFMEPLITEVKKSFVLSSDRISYFYISILEARENIERLASKRFFFSHTLGGRSLGFPYGVQVCLLYELTACAQNPRVASPVAIQRSLILIN